MRDALGSLQFVEKSSIKVVTGAATFEVTNPDDFKLAAVQKALGDRYKIELAKKGSSVKGD